MYIKPDLCCLLSAEITSEAEELCSKPQEESKNQTPMPENNHCNGLTTDQVETRIPFTYIPLPVNDCCSWKWLIFYGIST